MPTLRSARARLARWPDEVADAGLALVVLGLEVSFLVLVSPVIRTEPVGATVPTGVGVALLVLRNAPLVARRRAPLAVLGALTVLFAVNAAAELRVPDASLMVAVFTAAALVPRRRSWIALGVLLATVAAIGAATGRAELLPFEVLITFCAWILGDRAQTARAYTASLMEAARLAGREREERSLRQLADERARIARELHDVVAQAVVLVVLQTGAARRVLRVQPDLADDLLGQVEASGRRSLEEMRRMLTVLRPGSGPGTRVSEPGLDDVAVLAGEFAAAGLPVRLELAGEDRPLPRDLSLTGYRVVQEGLTNALKHAAATEVVVRVDRADEGLVIEVLDNGAPPGDPGPRQVVPPAGGQGLRGMRERVEALGGGVEAGPRPGGGFTVRARLPLRTRPEIRVP